MTEIDKSSQGGLGLSAVLFVVFLILKLCGVVNWSWWYVTAPLWIPAALGLFLLGIVIIFALMDRSKGKQKGIDDGC